MLGVLSSVSLQNVTRNGATAGMKGSLRDVNIPGISAIGSMRNIEFHVSILILMVINCVHLFVTYITCQNVRVSLVYPSSKLYEQV
jgi:hypothetical protein